MKKAILSTIGILAILLTFSFTNTNEKTIKITSEKPVEFDMMQNGKITKGIKTPYEFKFNEEKGNFLFKAKNSDTKLNLSVKINNGGSLTANWTSGGICAESCGFEYCWLSIHGLAH